MTLEQAIECVEREQGCNKEDIHNCSVKECDKCEYSVDHEAFVMALDVILAELDNCQIGYTDCSDVMLRMWRDNIITDDEYYRIMDRLNLYWKG